MDEFKNISTACYSFARGGPRASATSTHRPLPQPEIKAQQRSRQQRRRRVELGSNVARCPCSFNHLVDADGQGRGHGERFFTTSSFALARAAITSAALLHPDRRATRDLATFHRAV